jgi:hypothetical protein
MVLMWEFQDAGEVVADHDGNTEVFGILGGIQCLALKVIWFPYFLPLPGYVDHLAFVRIEVHLHLFPFLEVVKVFLE